jgi:hypothetical protein
VVLRQRRRVVRARNWVALWLEVVQQTYMRPFCKYVVISIDLSLPTHHIQRKPKPPSTNLTAPGMSMPPRRRRHRRHRPPSA